MKKKLLTALLMATITTSIVMPVKADNQMFTFPDGTGYYIEDVDHLYPETGIITEIVEEDGWFVLKITVANGNQFKFATEDGDWFVNDIVSMQMNSMDTELVRDHEIIKIKYAGTLEQLAQWAK